jgi:hypothetical protein
MIRAGICRLRASGGQRETGEVGTVSEELLLDIDVARRRAASTVGPSGNGYGAIECPIRRFSPCEYPLADLARK